MHNEQKGPQIYNRSTINTTNFTKKYNFGPVFPSSVLVMDQKRQLVFRVRLKKMKFKDSFQTLDFVVDHWS